MPRIANLFRSIREQVAADRIFLPGKRKNANWPICLTCGREPYSVNLEDVSRWSVDIKVKCCHKAFSEIKPSDKSFEDSVRVNIPVGTDRDEHIAWALKSMRFFDPTRPPK
jgi:hypothetical protein